MKFLPACKRNKSCQSDSLLRGSFCAGRYACTKRHSTNYRCTWRYERGSKINETSHVLNLRHVVAGLAALKYVGSLYLTSFVPGAK